MSGQFSTDNINLVIKKSPLALSPTTKQKKMKQKIIESSIVSNEIERDGLRIPKKIDSTWAVSKVLLQKKGKVALKDLRRFNELTPENQRGLNRQRKVRFIFFILFLLIYFNLLNRKQFFYKMLIVLKMKNKEIKFVGKQNLVLIHYLMQNEKILLLVDGYLGMNIQFVDLFYQILFFSNFFFFSNKDSYWSSNTGR
jgi:hypothetical protein